MLSKPVISIMMVEMCHPVDILLYYLYHITYICTAISGQKCFTLLTKHNKNKINTKSSACRHHQVYKTHVIHGLFYCPWSLIFVCFILCFQLDPRIIQPFLTECRETITKLDNQNMKAIKGLEDRLYALDQMIASCKKLVNEQKELAQVSKSHFYSL